jgi:hypothetical protein
VKLRTADGQEFDAWVNSPENDRKVPKWLGQIGNTTETRTTIQAPDGSQLTIGAGDVVVNEHGRLIAMSMRTVARLFDVIEGGEEAQGPQSVSIPAQTLQVGRPRQGMVTTDRGRLQPDSSFPGQVQDNSRAAAAATGDSGTAASEQDGQSAGESAGASDPTQASATGGPGEAGTDDPAFGATGGSGSEVETRDPDETGGETDESDDDEEVKPHRRRSKK